MALLGSQRRNLQVNIQGGEVPPTAAQIPHNPLKKLFLSVSRIPDDHLVKTHGSGEWDKLKFPNTRLKGWLGG